MLSWAQGCWACRAAHLELGPLPEMGLLPRLGLLGLSLLGPLVTSLPRLQLWLGLDRGRSRLSKLGLLGWHLQTC